MHRIHDKNILWNSPFKHCSLYHLYQQTYLDQKSRLARVLPSLKTNLVERYSPAANPVFSNHIRNIHSKQQIWAFVVHVLVRFFWAQNSSWLKVQNIYIIQAPQPTCERVGFPTTITWASSSLTPTLVPHTNWETQNTPNVYLEPT